MILLQPNRLRRPPKGLGPSHAVGQILAGSRRAQRLSAAGSSISPPASANHEAMSFRAIVATDRPVLMPDFDYSGLVDEILHAKGGRFPATIPVLDSHVRGSIRDILGAMSDFRRVNGEWFASGELTRGVAACEEAYVKIAAGHLTDVSIGYHIGRYQMVAAGRSAKIDGRTYMAGPDRPLRVVSEWLPYELSIVAVGADETAKIRNRDALRTEQCPPGRLPITRFL